MMNTAEFQAAASRLCAACGMCCNGVMFYSMRLQPEDSARQLVALGLKLKRRKDGAHFLQPCPAHSGTQCTIYAHRPERCRLFNCRQLMMLEAGKTNETRVLERIREVRKSVDHIRELFHQAGDHRENKSFSTRYESIFTEPLDASESAATLREHLKVAMAELQELLSQNFHPESK